MATENSSSVPPRVQAALDYLSHVRWVTQQDDASIPARTLSPLERSVESAALRTLQSYFLCEMDFGDAAPIRSSRREEDDGEAPVLASQPK